MGSIPVRVTKKRTQDIVLCSFFVVPSVRRTRREAAGLQRSPFGEANVALPKGNKGYLPAKARNEPKRDSRTGESFKKQDIVLCSFFVVPSVHRTRREAAGLQRSPVGEANHNDTKYLITHNLPARAIIV